MNVQPIDVAIFTLTSPWPAIAVASVMLLGVGTVVLLDVLERRSQS